MTDKKIPVHNLDDTDDPVTEALVDEIVVRESDELLAAHDRNMTAKLRTEPPRGGLGNRLRGYIAAWWHNKLARYVTLLVLFAGLAALAAMPTSRYYALNSVGVRSGASLSVLDNTTQLPLKNVSVELGDRKAKSNQDGIVKMSGLKLGLQSLTIRQAGFAAISKTVTLGLGSNPLGEFTLDAVGTQFRFKLTDFLSGKPVKNAEISSGDSNARGDDKGQVVLTLEQQGESGGRKAVIKADGYRSEDITLEAGQNQSRSLVMVPSQKEVYISKQSGKYDLYKIDLDGRNKQILLPASGYEDSDITVVAQSGGQEVALVSRRDNQHNQDGFPLQALTIVDVDKGTTLTLDHSERIQIVDWTGEKLVYIKIKAGTSAGNPERYQLVSYDYNTTARLQLASANYFNDIVAAGGYLYFAASNNFQGGTSQVVRIAPDGTGKQVLLDKTDVWNILRTSYNTLAWPSLYGNYEYRFGDSSARKVSNSPAVQAETRFYLDASDGKHALWTDSRDGKGVLLVYGADSNKDTTLATQSGLTFPVRWLNARTVVYRVATPSETADYAVSLDGGAPRKIVNLTNTSGLGRFNYR